MVRVSPPSSFFSDQLDRIRTASRLGAVLDLACGRGRHCLAAAEAGVAVIGIDRNRDSLAELQDTASRRRLAVQTVLADLESPAEIPIARERCGVVLVFRYLHRPLSRAITRILAPGGLLIYETFTADQAELGNGPRNPHFLLQRGELCDLFSELEIVEHWEGVNPDPHPAALARLVARARP
jgi:SAM-dependent methyltransferase